MEPELSNSLRAALIDEAQRLVHPLRIAARPSNGGFRSAVVREDGSVLWPDYGGAAPTELLAILAAEQRYTVEQVGGGAVPGLTYLEKARERVRRGPVHAGANGHAVRGVA